MHQTCSALAPELSRQAEIELVAAVQQDPGAFRMLYEQYARPVYRYLYSLAGNQAEAEDLTSQVFLKALEDLVKFRNQGGFRAWLFTIARSKAMDAYRKRRRELPLDVVDLPSPDPDPLATAIHREEVERMRKRLSALPEDEQELLRLRFVAGLSYAEIGEVLKRSEGAVKKALYRLLDRLEEQMEEDHA
jgi:RNA polymerase sigma-70 factor (ECF subfamily)